MLLNAAMVMVHLLLWACIEDAVAKSPESDARVMVRLGPVVQVHSQQAHTVPNRRGNCGDKEKNRCGEEEEDSDPVMELAEFGRSRFCNTPVSSASQSHDVE